MALTFQLLKVFIASGHLLCPGNPRSAIPQWVKPRSVGPRWSHIPEFPAWLAGTVIASEILEFSRTKTSRKKSSQSIFFSSKLPLSLNGKLKLPNEIEHAAWYCLLKLNSVFCCQGTACWSASVQRGPHHEALISWETNPEGLPWNWRNLCIFAAFASLHPKLNHTATTGIQQNESMDDFSCSESLLKKRCSPWLHLAKALTQGIRLPFHPCPGRILIGVDWMTSSTHKTTSRTKWVSLKLGSGWVF